MGFLGNITLKVKFLQIGPGDGYILTATGYDSGLSTAPNGFGTPMGGGPMGDGVGTHNGMKFSTW